jgi:CelD/BcsL family acetyltransferase involved in cellulose biosynthesis
MPKSLFCDTGLTFLALLDHRQARQVSRLERRLHRKRQREGTRELRDLLRNATAARANLSLGMFDQGRLVGYIIVYIREDSWLDASVAQPVVYVHDLAILPRYSAMLRALMRESVRSFKLLATGLPVEAHFLPPEYKLSHLCTHFMDEQGYMLSDTKRSNPSPLHTEQMSVRWSPLADRPIPRRHPAKPNRQSYASVGGDHSVGIITTESGWLALEADWKRLLERIPDATVFHSFEYQWHTWRHLGTSNHLFIIVVRRDNEVTGIAPFELRPRNEMGGWHRELGLIGTPWEVERSRLLIEPGDVPTLDAIAHCLLDHRQCWDLCTLWEIAPGDLLMERLMTNLSGEDLLLAQTHSSTCPYIDLDGSWEDYLAGRSRRLRKNLRRSKRRLEAIGKLRMKEILCWPEAEEAMADYLTVEIRSWKHEKGLGIGRNPWHFGFYKGLAKLYSQAGRFDLRILTLDDEPIAATFGIHDRGTFYSMRIAHDLSFNAYSPGTLLEAMELESLFAEKVNRYDPLGGFLTNKVRWADSSIETITLHIYSRTWRLRALYLVFFRLKPALRNLLTRMGLFEAALEVKDRVERYRSGRARAPIKNSQD